MKRRRNFLKLQVGGSQDHHCFDIVSPERMHGLADFSDDQSEEAEDGGGDGGLEHKW